MPTTMTTANRAGRLARDLAILGLLLAPLAPAARAQDQRPIKTEQRRDTSLAEAFGDVARKVAPSVVEVSTMAGDDLGYAVAIGDGTTLLTSRSILDATPEPTVRVRTTSGGAAVATVLGRNEAYDVALLKLRGGLDVKALPLGSSRALDVGAWVISVGTAAARPLAVGVVSALDRRVEPRAEAPAVDLFGLFGEQNGPRRAYARVIQHDSPVDVSRQGGSPLVDAEGRLIGINVANAYRGSSYAAPIDDVAAFLDDLAHGKPGPGIPKPGFIGVGLGPIADAAVAKSRGIDGPGAEIKGTMPGTPAEKAGLRTGDVILKIDGESIQGSERVGQIIRGVLPGKTVKLLLLREGKEIEVPVVVGDRPNE